MFQDDGPLNYHECDQSATESVINGNYSPREITLGGGGDKTGKDEDSVHKKANGNSIISKAEKGRNSEEREHENDFRTTKSENGLINVLSNMVSNIYYNLHVYLYSMCNQLTQLNYIKLLTEMNKCF
jgi:hypothetical protein